MTGEFCVSDIGLAQAMSWSGVCFIDRGIEGGGVPFEIFKMDSMSQFVLKF